MSNNPYSDVRIGWQTGGQPGWKIDEDKAFVRAVPIDDEYNRTRDIKYATNDIASVKQSTTYHRVWQVFWTFYGPNSLDQARKVRSGLLNGSIQIGNLKLIPDIAEPIRAPENYEGQWWERVDMDATFNELVTEDLTVPTVAFSEIIIETENGIVADFNVT